MAIRAATVRQFLANLDLTAGQAGDGVTKHTGVVATLNRAYRNVSEGSTHRVLIGSWAKETRVRPPRDIDLLFILPIEVYYRFTQRQGNVHSQLLQEVRDVLRITYRYTDIRGDRQVVVVPFDTCQVEVAPAFHRQGGGYLVATQAAAGAISVSIRMPSLPPLQRPIPSTTAMPASSPACLNGGSGIAMSQ